MIAIRSLVFPSLVATSLLAATTFAARTATMPVEEDGVLFDTDVMPTPVDDMAALVRAFYATRDATLAPTVQDWLTTRREGVIDPDALDHAMRLARRAQLEACTMIDPHGGDVTLDIAQSADGRTMHADGTNADVVECIETIASSIQISNGSTSIALAYHSGVLLDAHVEIGPIYTPRAVF